MYPRVPTPCNAQLEADIAKAGGVDDDDVEVTVKGGSVMIQGVVKVDPPHTPDLVISGLRFNIGTASKASYWLGITLLAD